MSALAITGRGRRLVSLWLLSATVLSAPALAEQPPASLAPAAAVTTNMPGMDMTDDHRFGKVLLNQFEATRGDGSNGQAWDAYAWYGSDLNKFALRTEGDHGEGRAPTGDVEALWSRAVGAFWDTELGLRRDFGNGPARDWAAFGVQGIAPYWLDVEATGYVSSGGRAAARFKAEYELLITQRVVLQPEIETNLYTRSDPARRVGSGIADASIGVRLRYEIRREFAPYLGVVWQRAYGRSAEFRRADNLSVLDRRIVAGLRIWF